MNYEDMSDREIECLVWAAGDSEQRKYTTHGRSLVLVEECGRMVIQDVPRVCNNPSDAWPIIELIWGELMKPPYRGHGTTWERLIGEYSCGKLRAAMICFLKMKDAEK